MYLKVALYKTELVIYNECMYTTGFPVWKFIGSGPISPLQTEDNSVYY